MTEEEVATMLNDVAAKYDVSLEALEYLWPTHGNSIMGTHPMAYATGVVAGTLERVDEPDGIFTNSMLVNRANAILALGLEMEDRARRKVIL